MPKTLIVPGVSIATQFDVAPPLPARSGILGAVGVVDRIPDEPVRSVTTRQDLLSLYGPATLFSFPEVFRALANGVSEVVVSPVNSRSGQAASVALKDSEGEDVVVLRARAVGPWGNDLAVRVTRRLGTDRETVRNVRLQVLLGGQVIETHDGLILRDGEDQDLFTTINRDSSVLVALDPVFLADLPARDLATVAFVDSPAHAAQGALRKGGALLLALDALAAGAAGNEISVAVADGHASLTLTDAAAGGAPSIRLTARQAGPGGHDILIRVTANAAAGGVDLAVTGLGGHSRSYPGLTGVNAVVDALNTDPDVRADRLGNVTPAPMATSAALAPTRSVTVRIESVRTTHYDDLPSADAIVTALAADTGVKATLAAGASGSDLPDPDPVNELYLTGGRDAGLARGYRGQNTPTDDVLVLVPAPGSDGTKTRFQVTTGSAASTVRLLAGVDAGAGFQLQESFDSLVMDPDSDRYLPQVLSGSGLLRAIDRAQRSRATTFPVDSVSPERLSGGAAPTLAAYQNAVDALEREDAVDMMLAGLQEWADSALDGVAVHRAMLAHARTQADNARPRIVLGSIRPEHNHDVERILDHAVQVADRRFALVAPSGAEGAVAGLLGHLEFFQSPTFKTVAAPGVPLVPYGDAELNKLVGPDGNICVVTQRRGRGTIVVKGIATDSFQISVTRVADRCVREVKAIADRFIGELNNADSRNALKQMIVATFTQLERDGALVPSVDGKDPAFIVDVFASQNDTAAGIVRIDIAVRPVRSIDYVYATIRVKN